MFICAKKLENKFIIYESYNIDDKLKEFVESECCINNLIIFKAREYNGIEISKLLKNYKLLCIQNYKDAENVCYFDEFEYAANIIQKYWRIKILFRWLPKSRKNTTVIIR